MPDRHVLVGVHFDGQVFGGRFDTGRQPKIEQQLRRRSARIDRVSRQMRHTEATGDQGTDCNDNKEATDRDCAETDMPAAVP